MPLWLLDNRCHNILICRLTSAGHAWSVYLPVHILTFRLLPWKWRPVTWNSISYCCFQSLYAAPKVAGTQAHLSKSAQSATAGEGICHRNRQSADCWRCDGWPSAIQRNLLQRWALSGLDQWAEGGDQSGALRGRHQRGQRGTGSSPEDDGWNRTLQGVYWTMSC